jgi:hypothetical protein
MSASISNPFPVSFVSGPSSVSLLPFVCRNSNEKPCSYAGALASPDGTINMEIFDSPAAAFLYASGSCPADEIRRISLFTCIKKAAEESGIAEDRVLLFLERQLDAAEIEAVLSEDISFEDKSRIVSGYSNAVLLESGSIESFIAADDAMHRQLYASGNESREAAESRFAVAFGSMRIIVCDGSKMLRELPVLSAKARSTVVSAPAVSPDRADRRPYNLADDIKSVKNQVPRYMDFSAKNLNRISKEETL